MLDTAYSVAVDRALVEKGTLHDFVRMAWPIVEPSKFIDNWHVGEICAHLEAVSRGEILRLVINQPPGTNKSTVSGVFWNVWEWIKRPETKFIYASYDVSLVSRDADKVIRLLHSEWFRARWTVNTLETRPASANFLNRYGGFRFSTSPQGKATGRHGDIQVCDDPIKPKDANGGSTQTKNALRFVSTWWSETMAMRATNAETFRRVIIMQRLHAEDLAGEMLATGRYTHLCLPMRYDTMRPCRTKWGGDQRTTEGELLFPKRFPEHVVKDLETHELGPDVAAAQLQQSPSIKGGGIFKRAWFRFWHTKPDVPEPCMCDDCWKAKRTLPGHVTLDTDGLTLMCAVPPRTALELQSWDCAFKGKADSDYVSGGLWRNVGRTCYLIDCVNERLSFPETKNAIVAMSAKHPRAYDKLIEDAANGPAVESELKHSIHGIVMIPAMGGKEARAHAASPAYSGGNVYLPHPDLAPWVRGFISQHETFPRGVNDDMVDMATQAIIRLRKFGIGFSEAMAKIRAGQK